MTAPFPWAAQIWGSVRSKSGGVTSSLGDWLAQLERDHDTHIGATADLAATKRRAKCWTLITGYRMGSARQPENIVWRAPAALHDLDDVGGFALPGLIARLRADPCVVLAAVTLSGTGVRVIVCTPEWWHPDGPDYKTVWAAAGEHVLRVVGPLPPGAKLDRQVSDPGRLTFPLLIPPGTAGEWNPHATPIPFTFPPPAPEIRTVEPAPADDPGGKIPPKIPPGLPAGVEHDRLVDALAAIPADAGNTVFQPAVFAANAAGLTADEIVAWAADKHGWHPTETPRRIRHICATSTQTPGPGALVNLAKDYGWDPSLRRWQSHRGGEGGRPVGRADSTTRGAAPPGRHVLDIDGGAGDRAAYVAGLDHLGVRRRWDMIAHRPEIRLDDAKWPDVRHDPIDGDDRGGWRWLTDRLDAEIRVRFHDDLARPVAGKKPQNFNFTAERWALLGASHDFRHAYDPLRDWLDGLPEPGGDPLSWLGFDEGGPFLLPADAPEHAAAMAEWAGRYIVAVICARSIRRSKADICPVLVGPQGVGKSSWLWHVLPPHLRHLWRSVDLTDPDAKRIAEKMDGMLLSEWAEIDGARAWNLARIKALLTDPQISYRPAYGRHLRDVTPRGVFVATSNNPQPLPADDTGNRRFAVVTVDRRHPTDAEQGAAIGAWWAEHRDRVWARADALAKAKIPDLLTLPPALAAHQTIDNYDTRYRGPIEEAAELVLDGIDTAAVTVAGLWYSLPAEIRRGETLARHTHRLAAALRECGWTLQPRARVGTRTIRYWTCVAVGPSAGHAKSAVDHETFALRGEPV